MNGLIRISEAASIGLHGALALAAAPERRWSARAMGAQFGFSSDHVSKVMRALGRAGIVAATRGPGGGVRLGRPAGDITLLAVYEAIEGPLQTGGCLLASGACRARCCSIGPQLADANRRLRGLFATTTLADMAAGFNPSPARAVRRRKERP